jgi:N4-(beta-N-acetylglucosaminyl)-L-asparaginase
MIQYYNMVNRRKFIQKSILSTGSFLLAEKLFAGKFSHEMIKPVVVSTWDIGLNANKAAWQILGRGGRALDAVEEGVKLIEGSQSCCVGLGAYPDRDGKVTLDSCIMDEFSNCGSVAFLERIKHPISVARAVMEKTPHVMLVGSGAQQFAISEGFPLEDEKLSPEAEKVYQDWLKKSNYKPVMNVENKRSDDHHAPGHGEAPLFNHDTIGMVAMDANGNLSGSCTTSGLAFKMHGRVGDSPIIGAGLFVDNEVGACTATGVGEEVIRICGSHTVVELMRQGLSPEEACRQAIERIVKNRKNKPNDIQVAFLAINKNGETGSYALQKGFNYAIRTIDMAKLIPAKNIY